MPTPLYGLGVIEKEYLKADHPIPLSELKVNVQRVFEALHNEFVASALAVKVGHEINPDFMIGCMIAHMTAYPLTLNPKDIFVTFDYDNEMNNFCGDVQVRGEYPAFTPEFFKKRGIDPSFITEEDKKILKEGTVDMYTFSYYMSNCMSSDENAEKTAGNMSTGVKNPYLKASDWGWQIDPDELRYTLNKLRDRYLGTPLMVVENGFGAFDKVKEDGSIHDDYCVNYFRPHIKAWCPFNWLHLLGINRFSIGRNGSIC